MEFIFLPDFRSYGFGDLPIWSSRGRRKWRTRGRNTRGGRRYRFTFITGAFTLQKIVRFLVIFLSTPLLSRRTCHLVRDIKFYLFIKNFGLLSLRIFFGTESPFFSISSRVYEVNPDIFCFPLRGFPCRASFLPRFKTVSITIRTAINNKQRRRAP